jgi:hypothetical protein
MGFSGRAAFSAATSSLVLLAVMAIPTANASASVVTGYECAVTGLGAQQLYLEPVVITASSAPAFKPGAPVHLSRFQANVTIPSSIVALMEAAGMKSVDGIVNPWYVKATDVVTKKSNVDLPSGFTIPTINLPKTPASVSFVVPATARAVGSWTAGSQAGTITFSTGALKFILRGSPEGISLPVTCIPHPTAPIAQATVK